MDSQGAFNVQPNESTLSLKEESAIIVGIIGLLLPVGIQDFVVHRFFWGSMHIAFLLLSPVGLFLWLFDGYCAGGEFCSRPPGIMSFIGSFILGCALSLLILNLIECMKLMLSRTIVFSKKSSAITMGIFTIVIIAALFAYRLFMYYS